MKKIFVLIIVSVFAYGTNAQVAPLIQNDWQNFMWPYNAYYPLDSNAWYTCNGHVGNSCGQTALARIFHYWQYPANGNGILDFIDDDGFYWYLNLDSLNLDFSDMPYTLQSNDPDSIYQETAKLMFACGAFATRIKLGWGGGNDRLIDSLPKYFNVSDQITIKNRWDYTRNDWITLFKNELDNGRPILIDGRTVTSPAPWEPGNWEGHYFVCDGYNSLDQFNINYSYDSIFGYFDIDSMGDFCAYHMVFVNFMPDIASTEESLFDLDQNSFFPNPTFGTINVIIKRTDQLIEIFTTQGQLLFRKMLNFETDRRKIQIDLSSFPNTLYLIKISDENGPKMGKVLKY